MVARERVRWLVLLRRYFRLPILHAISSTIFPFLICNHRYESHIHICVDPIKSTKYFEPKEKKIYWSNRQSDVSTKYGTFQKPLIHSNEEFMLSHGCAIEMILNSSEMKEVQKKERTRKKNAVESAAVIANRFSQEMNM